MEYGLTFRLVGEHTEDHVTRVLLLVNSMVKSRTWPAGPPSFFDELDESGLTRSEDCPVRYVGGFVPLRRPGRGLAPEADREDFEAVAYVVEQLRDFTGALELDAEVSLGGTYAGHVRGGVADRLVKEALLGEWERVLISRGH